MWASIWFYLSGSALVRWLARRLILLALDEARKRVIAINADANAAEVEAQALEAQAREAMQRAVTLKREAETWAREHPITALIVEKDREG